MQSSRQIVQLHAQDFSDPLEHAQRAGLLARLDLRQIALTDTRLLGEFTCTHAAMFAEHPHRRHSVEQCLDDAGRKGLYARIDTATGLVRRLNVMIVFCLLEQRGVVLLAQHHQALTSGRYDELWFIHDSLPRDSSTIDVSAGADLSTAGLPTVMGIPIDRRPALGATAPAQMSSEEININVYGSPGMDEMALARYVAAEVQRALAQNPTRLRLVFDLPCGKRNSFSFSFIDVGLEG